MHINRTFADMHTARPHQVEQLRAAEHPVGASYQYMQQLELGQAQLQFAFLDANAATDRVERDASYLDNVRSAAAGAPEHGMNAGNQLLGRKRLGHVIIGPRIEPMHLVFFLATRRQHDDRQSRCFRSRTKPPRQINPRHVRQHPVKQDEIDKRRI